MKLFFVFLSLLFCISCNNANVLDNSKARLSSLVLLVDDEECEIKPAFTSDQFEYEATCNGEEVTLLAYPIYSKAKVQDVVKSPLDVVEMTQQMSFQPFDSFPNESIQMEQILCYYYQNYFRFDALIRTFHSGTRYFLQLSRVELQLNGTCN